MQNSAWGMEATSLPCGVDAAQNHEINAATSVLLHNQEDTKQR